MKLSKESTQILKNFAGYNTGMHFAPGTFISTCTNGDSVYASAQLNDEIDLEATVYDLNGFLNVLSLADDDAEITVTDDKTQFAIKSARSVIYWDTADKSSITVPQKAMKFPTANVIIDFSAEDHQQLARVARGVGVTTVIISNKDGKIVLDGYNKDADRSFSKALYSLDLAKYDEDKPDFSFVISLLNFKLLPGAYKIMLWGRDHMMATFWEGEQASYIIATEKESMHKFPKA